MFNKNKSYFLKQSVRRYVQCMAAGAVSLAFMPGALLAQEVVQPDKSEALEEVVVTGTLIRGVEAVGSQTIGLDSKDIVETGAVSTNEILATVPQVSNFFNQRPEQDPRGADRNSLNRPNLRNLPGINSATGGTTLVLIDGHRLTPMGVSQSDVDPDVIPANVLQNVDIVTDGGSSLYGADAVGGVINFATLKEFEGVEIDLGYDMGDDYGAWQASVLAGTLWTGGSGYISLSTTDRDNIKNGDRDWANAGNWSQAEDGKWNLSPSGTECVNPVGAKTTWFNFGAGWTDNPRAPGAGVTPVGEPCDIEAQSSLLPKQQRDNIYGGLTQELSDGITLDTKAYYMKRSTHYSGYPRGATIAEPSPNDTGVVGVSGDLYDTSQVGFSYGANDAYIPGNLKIDIETWGITPEITIDLPHEWQLRNTLHYGYSTNHSLNPGANRDKMLAYVADGSLDPLNVAAAEPAVIEDILDWGAAIDTKQEMFLFRSVADGEVFELPAGPLRAAVGVEYIQNDAKTRKGDAPINGLSGYRSSNRDVQSAFAELSIPALESLDFSVSVRYDDYSDFGSTSNPGYGVSWTPVEWLMIYGKISNSFNAPTALDALGTADGRFVYGRVTSVPDPNGEIDPARQDVLLLEGSDPGLKPQTADIWAAGFDLMPLEGLSFNFNYYSIEFFDLLGSPNPQDPLAVLLNPDKFNFNPTQAEYDAALAAVVNGDSCCVTDASSVGVIIDRRISNTDEAKLEGMDFGVQYYHDTDFGQMSYALLGNYQSKFELYQNGTTIDQLQNEPDMYGSANIGWSKDNMRARLTLNYTDEYDASTSAVDQTKVDSFLVTNLFVGYSFRGASGITEGLSLRLNVDNVFDEDPPQYRRQQLLNYSGFTLGRVFKMGLTKAF